MITATATVHTAHDAAGLFWLSRRLLAEHRAARVDVGQYLVQLADAGTVLLTELPDALRFDVVVRDELAARRTRRALEAALERGLPGTVSAMTWQTEALAAGAEVEVA
jgi:nucleoside-triphosphatase THEP1